MFSEGAVALAMSVCVRYTGEQAHSRCPASSPTQRGEVHAKERESSGCLYTFFDAREPCLKRIAGMRQGRLFVTSQKNFKTLVRQRMAETGQNFTAARAQFLEEYAQQVLAAENEHRTVVTRFFKDGALTAFPSKRKARAHVLLYLVNLFDIGVTYTEKDINEKLRALWPDFAYLRRELIDYGYLQRDNAGSYWLTSVAPNRWETVLHSEAPEWEALWLPAYLNGQAQKFNLDN